MLPETLVVRPGAYQEDAEPFVKWAGGKGRLLGALTARLPDRIDRYVEPFLGGGALYFALQPGDARLSDRNGDLVEAYETVRDDVEGLIAALRDHRYERDHYYRVRAQDPRTLSRPGRAARLLYLNRTCFNGLYRVNRRGHFNVPFGRHKDPVICPAGRLRAASRALQAASFGSESFEEAVAGARRGDFVYFDPPYQPLTKTARFTAYTVNPFGPGDQARLAATFAGLDRAGVKCLLSNSYTPLVMELYDGFRIEVIEAPRAISRDSATRTPVREVLVRNY
jgi:DNA adenine methylase